MGNNEYQDDIVTIQIERKPEISMAGYSIVGTREYQQDTYFMMDMGVRQLAVICDGMGGMEQGELASQKAVEKLVGDFEEWNGESDIVQFLKREANEMDKIVADLVDDSGRKLDAGTTVVAILIMGNYAYWLSVGDSRIYILRGNEMLCVTRDHNYGYQMKKKLESGEITEEEYTAEKKQFEALVSYVGMDGLEMVDVNRTPFQLEFGDRILLCSDGLYKCLTEDKLRELLLYENRGVDFMVEKLIEEVKAAPKKNKDNTTVICLTYQ